MCTPIDSKNVKLKASTTMISQSLQSHNHQLLSSLWLYKVKLLRKLLRSISITITMILSFKKEILNSLFFMLYILSASCTSGVDCFDWVQIPGGLKHVSTSINYHWGVNTANHIFRCARPCAGAWIKIAGALKQVDVSDMEVWGVSSANDIYKRAADGSGSAWTKVSGKLKHVSASGNGYIWGVNSIDNIYLCKKPCNGQWVKIPGKLKQIDGGEQYVYGVSSGNMSTIDLWMVVAHGYLFQGRK